MQGSMIWSDWFGKVLILPNLERRLTTEGGKFYKRENETNQSLQIIEILII